MADGSITIETLLSTDKFDRQIVGLEKKMQKEEEKKITIEAQLSSQEQDLERARAEVDRLADAYQRVAELQKQVDKGVATPQQFMELSNLKSEFGSIEQIGSAFDKALDSQDRLTEKVEQTKAKYNDINNKVNEYKQKVEGIKLQKHQADIEGISKSFKNVGNSIQDSIKKVGRLALAIFGIRTALSYLRSASSELASYDEQYATNLEYIRFVLAQAIAPVLQAIVNLAMQLLSYINMIAQAWFGINLFANGSVENFQKMKKQATGVGKAVKEIKKELLGFDEINRLTDTDTGTSAGAGGTGMVMPSMDLSEIQGEPPEWLKWILDNGETIAKIILAIAGALGLMKLGVSGLKALGIGFLITGIISLIKDLLDYLNDPSWKNFGDIIFDIGMIITGIGFLIGGLPVAIAGAIVMALGLIIQNWEEIKGVLENGLGWFKNKSDWVHKYFGDIIGGIYDAFVANAQRIIDHFDRLFTDIKAIFDGIIEFITGVFEGNWEKAWNGLSKIFTNIWDILVETVDFSLKLIDNFIDNIAEGIASTFWWVVDSVSGWFKDLADNITIVFQWVIDSIGNWLWDMATSLPDAISGVIRGAVNALLSFVESMINAPISALNALIGVINSIPGVSIGYLGTVSFPKLAKGSILNAPGRGTLVGGGQAIAGEAGREAYLPLSDHQLLEELGSTIGKYITINAEIVNSMNGRVISRELQQIQNENAFAYNS